MRADLVEIDVLGRVSFHSQVQTYSLHWNNFILTLINNKYYSTYRLCAD